jgi:hypothetical protein
MAAPRPTSDRRDRPVLAFAPPYERDGPSVITATAARSHTATHGAAADGEGSGFDAQMAGSRPMGAFVLSDGRVRWHPVIDVTKVLTTAELVVGAVMVAPRLSRPIPSAEDPPVWHRAAPSRSAACARSVRNSGGTGQVENTRRSLRRCSIAPASARSSGVGVGVRAEVSTAARWAGWAGSGSRCTRASRPAAFSATRRWCSAARRRSRPSGSVAGGPAPGRR